MVKVYRYAAEDGDIAHRFVKDRYIVLKQENDMTTLLLFSPDDADDEDFPVPLPPGHGLFIEVNEIPTRAFENLYKEDHEWPKSSQS